MRVLAFCVYTNLSVANYRILATAFLQVDSRQKAHFWQKSVSLKSDPAPSENSTDICSSVDVLDVTPLPGLPRNHSAVPAFSSLVWMHLPQAKEQMPHRLERLLEGELTEDLDIHFGEMVISDIGQSVRLQSDFIEDKNRC